MKNRSVQAMSIGLSMLALTGPVSMTAYAQTVDTSELSETPVEEPAGDNSEETALKEDVSNLTEQLNIDADVSEAVDNAATSIANVEKAAEASEEAIQEAEATVSSAAEVSEELAATTQQVGAVVESVVQAASDDGSSLEDVAVMISDAQKTVEEANDSFITAEENYNRLLSEYETAKSDYETAVAAYDANKTEALSSLDSASTALEDAGAKVQDLERQVAEAENELIGAGADALLAAEDGKTEDVQSYVSAVLEHFYIPNSEKLDEGQTVSNLSIAQADDEGHIVVSYDIVDADGQVLRQISADYGYTIDSEAGQVQLYTKELTYQYTDSSGEVVTLTKEEAEELEGQVEIANYWKVSGYYVPYYVDRMTYKGIKPMFFYRDEKSAIESGKEYVNSTYYDNKDYYKVGVSFDNDWEAERHLWGYYYDVTGGFTAIYHKTEDKGGYKVSKAVSKAQYSSESEAYEAAVREAKDTHKAWGIDETESKLKITNIKEYAAIEKSYVNSGDALWQDTATDYTTYLTALRTRVVEYQILKTDVETAKAGYQEAQEKVQTIKSKISALKGADDIVSQTQFAILQVRLDIAKESFTEAKNTLETAKENLATAEKRFGERLENQKKSLDDPEPVEVPSTETQPTKESQTTTDSQAEEQPGTSETPAPINEVPSPVKELPVEEQLQIADTLKPKEKTSSVSKEITTIGDLDQASGGEYSDMFFQVPIIFKPLTEIAEGLQEETIPEKIDSITDSIKNPKSSESKEADVAEAEQQPVDDGVPQPLYSSADETTIPEEEVPKAITLSGLLQRGRWFAGLAAVSIAGAIIGFVEAKRRAAAKIIDKMNQ